MIEHPDEIDPSVLVHDYILTVLIRDPGVQAINKDGSRTELVPSALSLMWNKVPLVGDPDNCEHALSVCSQCADDWNIDYYVRITDLNGETIWQSYDCPPAG